MTNPDSAATDQGSSGPSRDEDDMRRLESEAFDWELKLERLKDHTDETGRAIIDGLQERHRYIRSEIVMLRREAEAREKGGEDWERFRDRASIAGRRASESVRDASSVAAAGAKEVGAGLLAALRELGSAFERARESMRVARDEKASKERQAERDYTPTPPGDSSSDHDRPPRP